MPQSESDIRPRKDGIDSSSIGTITFPAKRSRNNSVASIIKADNTLIAIHFKRTLLVLEQVLCDQLQIKCYC